MAANILLQKGSAPPERILQLQSEPHGVQMFMLALHDSSAQGASRTERATNHTYWIRHNHYPSIWLNLLTFNTYFAVPTVNPAIRRSRRPLVAMAAITIRRFTTWRTHRRTKFWSVGGGKKKIEEPPSLRQNGDEKK